MQLGTATTDGAFDQLYRAQWHNMVRVALLLVDYDQVSDQRLAANLSVGQLPAPFDVISIQGR